MYVCVCGIPFASVATNIGLDFRIVSHYRSVFSLYYYCFNVLPLTFDLFGKLIRSTDTKSYANS
jgi:hypothetical protein